MRALCKWGVVAMGVLAFSVSARGLEPSGTLGLTMIPQDQLGEIHYVVTGGDVGGRWDCEDATPLYRNWQLVNYQHAYTSLRVPGTADPMNMADDCYMDLPNGFDEWEICGYQYMTYGFSGSAPYYVHSALYRFDTCTSTPTPLVDWNTGVCCVAPQEIAGTEADAEILTPGMVVVKNPLPAQPVMVDRYVFMHLTWTGATIHGNGGWIIAGHCDNDCGDIGFTDNFWAEGTGTGDPCLYQFVGGDPYAGFYAEIWGTSSVVFENVPVAPAEPVYCGGNEIILDCHDLPVCVQVEIYARDWDPTLSGSPLVKGFQTTINCASYATAMSGTLTAIDVDCTPGFAGCDYCTMGINKMHKDASEVGDYIFFLMGDNAACNRVDMCDNCTPGDPLDDFPGFYKCLSGAANTYVDPGVPQYMNHYAFIVSADTKGTWEVSLDTRSLYTQLADPAASPIVPLARIPALLTVETGMCCYNISAGNADCSDGVTECECEDDVRFPPPKFFGVGETCPPPPETCCQCLVDEDCDDGDACTVDTCDPICICNNAPITVAADECCDPLTGNVASFDDGDPCTDDYCDPGSGCAVLPDATHCGVPAHDLGPGNLCCEVDPANPAKALPCTYDDSCNWYCMDAGEPVQPLVICDEITGEPCPGACEWGCHGMDVNLIPCVDDTQCLVNAGTGYPCPADPVQYECKSGFCYCAETTRVWIDVEDEDCCFVPSTTFPVHVKKTPGADTVTGAQFVVYYDPDCVDYMGFDLGADFPLLLYEMHDPAFVLPYDTVVGVDVLPEGTVVGMVFLAVGIHPFSGTGTAGPATFATLYFHCKGPCIDCEICLGQAYNPPNTILTNDLGEQVTMISWGCSDNGDECETDADCNPGANCGCSCLIVQMGEDAIDVPDDVLTNSDCEKTTAMVTWDDPPSLISECEGATGLVCEGFHQPYPGQEEDQMTYEYVQTLIEGGGEFAQGVTMFDCNAFGQCDFPLHAMWTVEVTDQNAMDVIVQYSPEMTMGPYVRGIIFELFLDCYHAPVVECKDMVFGPPFEFVGKSTAILKVNKGEYDCVTARDPLHTIRSVDMPIECVGNALVVAFHGDPLLGGNWLINGNLNGDHHIDILDFGLFLSQYMMLMAADTPCGTPGPNADIDGNGIVNSADFAHIAMNFLEESKDACCDDPTSGWQGDPTLSITVKELRRRGMADLAIADLNGDGVLDQDDMVSFMQGDVPVRPDREIKRTGVRSLGR